MKLLLTLLLGLGLSTAAFTYEGDSTKSGGSNAEALQTCKDRGSRENIVPSGKLNQKIGLRYCGGSFSVTKSKGGKTAYIKFRDVKKCSNLAVGVNAKYLDKNITRHYDMDGRNGDYYKTIRVAKSLINHVSDKNVRVVIHSNSGKTCEQFKIYVGKKTEVN